MLNLLYALTPSWSKVDQNELGNEFLVLVKYIILKKIKI